MNIGGNSDVESIFKNAIACLNKTSIDKLGTYEEEIEKQKTVQIIIKVLVRENGLKYLNSLNDEELTTILRPCRVRIADLFSKKEYYKCFQETNNYYNFLENHLRITNNDNWFINRTYGSCYRRMNDKNKAIKHTKMALKYASNTNQFAELYFTIANAYTDIDLKKQIKYYDLAYECYKELKQDKICLDILNNKALYTSNIELAKSNIDGYKNLDSNLYEVDEARATLAYCYINHGMTRQAKDVIESITTEEFTIECNQKLEENLQKQLAVKSC